MIFQHTLPLILDAQKTQTRRVISTHEAAIRGRYNRIVAVVHRGRVKWRVGGTYAVQPGRGEAQVARIQLTKINSEQVTRISTADARAEGFAGRREFLNVWKAIHGDEAEMLRVWVLHFRLLEDSIAEMQLTYQSRSAENDYAYQ